MNAIKIALLGTAALAAVSVSARADDLSDLKAQIEALNSRISQLEATPSVPAGYQLLSMNRAPAIVVPNLINDLDTLAMVHNIGILPTADVPASTNIQWSGGVRVAVVHRSYNDKIDSDYDTKSTDILSRAYLKVVGTTDTAVGEVGVRIALVSDSAGRGKLNVGNKGVNTDGYWGWWKISPELTLGGGVDGSLAGNGNGFDGKCSCNYTGDGSGGYNHAGGDPSQIRLSYASGPISFAIAVEDQDNTLTKSAFGTAAELKWAGDTIGFELNAGYWNHAGVGDAEWTINAGANIGLGDIAKLSVAAGVGEDNRGVVTNDDRYSKASAFLGFSLSDSVSAELGVSHKWVKSSYDVSAAGVGLYYTPVSQLTFGLEGAWTSTKSKSTQTDLALLTIWRF